mgnify:CR=1 FL=1
MGFVVLAVGQGMRLAWTGEGGRSGLVSLERGTRLTYTAALDVALREGTRMARKGFRLEVGAVAVEAGK